MRSTYHLLPESFWATIDRTQPYRAESLVDEGFIHCTDGADELVATANRHYRDDPRQFVAMTVDLDLAGSSWTVEDERRIYPHVHGPIEPAAILAVQPIVRDDDGTFLHLGPIDQGPGSGG